MRSQGIHIYYLSIIVTVTVRMYASWQYLDTETQTEMGMEARAPGRAWAWKPPGQGNVHAFDRIRTSDLVDPVNC